MLSRLARTAGAAALVLALTAPIANAASPSAYVYATSRAETVRQYVADDAGLLADLFPPEVSAGSTSTWAAITPDNHTLYVVNQTSATVSQYDIHDDGTLAPKAVPTVATDRSPLGMAIAPDGRHAYVANQGAATVTVYSIDATGSLTAISTAPAGGGAGQIAITPDSAHAYVTNYTEGTVSQYDVNADGSLAPKDPAAVPALTSPAGIAVSPDGDSVYVANQGSAAVSQYSVGSDGALTPKDPATVPAGDQARQVLATDRSVYVSNLTDGTISQYDANADGTLSPKSPATVDAPASPTALVVSPDGHSLYVAGFDESFVGQYDVHADGTLSMKTPATVQANFRPSALAVARPPDHDAPTIDLLTPEEGARYTVGDRVEADYACADEGGSGLESCAGDIPNGEALDTTSPGDHRFTVVARDGEGNETTVTHGYTVGTATGFAFVGRIHDGSVVRPGSDVLIQFSLDGYQGHDVLADGSPRSARVACDHPGELTGGWLARSDRGLGYDAATGRYSFSWQTQRSWARTCRAFILELRDGSIHRLVLSFRSSGWSRPGLTHWPWRY